MSSLFALIYGDSCRLSDTDRSSTAGRRIRLLKTDEGWNMAGQLYNEDDPMPDRNPTERAAALSFRVAIWLTPIAYAVHIAEESIGFVPWVNTYLSPDFAFDAFVRNNAIFMAITLAYVILLALFQKRWLTLLFYWHFSSLTFFNALFHLGATAYFGVYSPGAVTAGLLYLPLWYYLTRLGHRQGLLPTVSAAVFWSLGGLTHAAVIYTQLINPNVASHQGATDSNMALAVIMERLAHQPEFD